MNTYRYRLLARTSIRTIGIVLGSMTAAFIIGIETAGDVQPISSTRASDSSVLGDFNGNGELDVEDAKIAIEIAEGNRTPTPEELAADPNRDFHITMEDAKDILDELALQNPSK